MRKLIIGSIAFIFALTLAFNGGKESATTVVTYDTAMVGKMIRSAYIPVRFYDGTGEITTTYIQDLKVWIGKVIPTTANGGSIDISSAGFAEVKTIILTPVFNTNNPMMVPDVVPKTVSNNLITYNIKTGSSTVVSILGATVNSSIFPSSTSGMEIYVRITGK